MHHSWTAGVTESCGIWLGKCQNQIRPPRQNLNPKHLLQHTTYAAHLAHRAQTCLTSAQRAALRFKPSATLPHQRSLEEWACTCSTCRARLLFWDAMSLKAALTLSRAVGASVRPLLALRSVGAELAAAAVHWRPLCVPMPHQAPSLSRHASSVAGSAVEGPGSDRKVLSGTSWWTELEGSQQEKLLTTFAKLNPRGQVAKLTLAALESCKVRCIVHGRCLRESPRTALRLALFTDTSRRKLASSPRLKRRHCSD